MCRNYVVVKLTSLLKKGWSSDIDMRGAWYLNLPLTSSSGTQRFCRDRAADFVNATQSKSLIQRVLFNLITSNVRWMHFFGLTLANFLPAFELLAYNCV